MMTMTHPDMLYVLAEKRMTERRIEAVAARSIATPLPYRTARQQLGNALIAIGNRLIPPTTSRPVATSGCETTLPA